MIQPSLLTKTRLYAIEKCADREVRKILDMIRKYRKITLFVEELFLVDKSIALKFVMSLPNNILRIYTAEKENNKDHRQKLNFNEQMQSLSIFDTENSLSENDLFKKMGQGNYFAKRSFPSTPTTPGELSKELCSLGRESMSSCRASSMVH